VNFILIIAGLQV